MSSGTPHIPARKVFPIPPLLRSTLHCGNPKKKQQCPFNSPRPHLRPPLPVPTRTRQSASIILQVLTPQAKNQNTSSSEAVYWEPYPYLTDCLLAWLSECPANHTILFYDKSSGESSSIPTNARATGHHKKDIYPVITKGIV
ncbi:hypothetical protein PAXRUDRAFT_822899 [Paxillus rubicundulus Ve08.2h10]|uniref:Uncharacterized protein n=1 Tax=Paxillus rubicundulus Ve08.2h10 TaxID=930991 RepID=A0A0D0E4H5_9AGAM|nr:hypothetical protein PAXRUDRAFT_822899 [Paxillus rubicundulus Ve08.2h10]